MHSFMRQQKWGVEIVKNGKQTGAAVGYTVRQLVNRVLNVKEQRMLRKHGVVQLVESTAA